MESDTTTLRKPSTIDWDALRRLRARFLEFGERGGGSGGAYWKDERELASYDATFAERIGWKWDAVLTELSARGWVPPQGRVVDWGCGTGVAARRVLGHYAAQCSELMLWDHSARARQYALGRVRELHPQVSARCGEPGEEPIALLLVSHVLNELAGKQKAALLALAERAQTVLWVEPGSAEASRALVSVREQLLGAFQPVGPCPQAGPCGMLAVGNEAHWCHHFAEAPGWVHRDGEWARFAKMLEIDVATVPYSWLALDRRVAKPGGEAHRLIGSPRQYKAFQKLLCCGAEGVREWILQKRDAPALFKEMKKAPGTLYHFRTEEGKIREGERIV